MVLFGLGVFALGLDIRLDWLLSFFIFKLLLLFILIKSVVGYTLVFFKGMFLGKIWSTWRFQINFYQLQI